MSNTVEELKKELQELELKVNEFRVEKARLETELEQLLEKKQVLEQRRVPRKRAVGPALSIPFGLKPKQIKNTLSVTQKTGRELQGMLGSFLYMVDYAALIFSALEANGWKIPKPNFSNTGGSAVAGGGQLPNMDQIADLAKKIMPLIANEGVK